MKVRVILRSSALACPDIGHGWAELEFGRLGVHDVSLLNLLSSETIYSLGAESLCGVLEYRRTIKHKKTHFISIIRKA